MDRVVQRMRISYLSILKAGEKSDCAMSPGQMLLVVFDGLFERVGTELRQLVELVRNAQQPQIWKKIDVIKEAKQLQV